MKLKKVFCCLMAAIEILAVCGCAKRSSAPPPATTEPPISTTAPTDPPETTAPPATTQPPETTVPPTTEPPETSSPSGNTEPPVTDPPETTVPPTTEPDPTDPPATEPPATEPPVTEPPATESPITEPPVTEHVHSYTDNVVAPTCTKDGYTEHTCSCGDSYTDSKVEATGHKYKSKTTKPTCTKDGYTKHTCSACGKSYKDSTVPATGHSYTEKVVAPTCAKDGYTRHTCSNCSDSYDTDPTPKGEHTWGDWKISEQPCWANGGTGKQSRTCSTCSEKEDQDFTQELSLADKATSFEAEIAAAILKYINQFRAEEGVAPLTYLPGMSQVAQYRSRQLVTRFEHNTTDIRAAHAYYQYGKYFELSDGTGYWGGGNEAIGAALGDVSKWSADRIALKEATALRESTGHWRYVGAEKNIYVGVGVTINADGYMYACIMVGTTNYG